MVEIVEVSLRNYMETRLEALEERMQMTQAANKEALLAAKEANEYRLAALNELRKTVEVMAATRASREDIENLRVLFYSELKSLRTEHDARIENGVKETKNIARQVYIIVGGIVALQFLWQYVAGAGP